MFVVTNLYGEFSLYARNYYMKINYTDLLTLYSRQNIIYKRLEIT